MSGLATLVEQELLLGFGRLERCAIIVVYICVVIVLFHFTTLRVFSNFWTMYGGLGQDSFVLYSFN